jgi:hypothetical protein
VIGAGNGGDVLVGKLLGPSIDQVAHVACVDEKNFIDPVAELAIGLVASHQRQAGIWVFKKSFAGRLTMQSTRRASIRDLRISPSPEDFEVSDPLASTKPA